MDILNISKFIESGWVDQGSSFGSMTRDALAQLVDLFEATETLVFAFDADDRLRMANAAFRAALHVKPDEHPTWSDLMRRNHAGQHGARIVTSDFEKWHMSALSRRGKVPSRFIEVDLHDGRWFTMSETVIDDGWMLCIGVDVTHLKASERALRVDRDDAQKAAQTDELTGISNRRHIMELLDHFREGRLAMGQKTGYACLLDIDHFKAVNDLHGHQAGDAVLQNFAVTVRNCIPSRDSFGRVGGEEFLVLLATDNRKDAQATVGKILHAVRTAVVLPCLPDFRITTSAGVAVIDGVRPSDAIYSRCDAALYQAKNLGRDRAEFEV